MEKTKAVKPAVKKVKVKQITALELAKEIKILLHPFSGPIPIYPPLLADINKHLHERVDLLVKKLS